MLPIAGVTGVVATSVVEVDTVRAVCKFDRAVAVAVALRSDVVEVLRAEQLFTNVINAVTAGAVAGALVAER